MNIMKNELMELKSWAAKQDIYTDPEMDYDSRDLAEKGGYKSAMWNVGVKIDAILFRYAKQGEVDEGLVGELKALVTNGSWIPIEDVDDGGHALPEQVRVVAVEDVNEIISRPAHKPPSVPRQEGLICPACGGDFAKSDFKKIPAPSLSTEELIMEIEKKRPDCLKCHWCNKFPVNEGPCRMCIGSFTPADNFKPISKGEGKAGK